MELHCLLLHYYSFLTIAMDKDVVLKCVCTQMMVVFN